MLLHRFVFLCLLFLPVLSHGQNWPFGPDSAKVYVENGLGDSIIRSFEQKIKNPAGDRNTIEFAEHLYAAGSLYYFTDAYEKADSVFSQCLQILVSVKGTDDPRYPHVLYQLGRQYVNLKKLDEADSVFQLARSIWRETKGVESDEYADGCFGCAFTREKLLDYPGAESYYWEAKQLKQKIFGRESLEHCTVMLNLSNLLQETGQHEKAEALKLEYAAIKKNMYGDKDPSYGVALELLSGLYDAMGQFDKAEQYTLQALKIYKDAKDDLFIAMGSYNLATVYMATGQYPKAEPLMLLAASTFGKMMGEDNETYAGVLQELGKLYHLMMQYQKAEKMLLRSASITKKVSATASEREGINNLYLALLYMDMKRYPESERIITKAMDELARDYGKEHKLYINTAADLASLYTLTSRQGDADKYFTEALRNQSRDIEKIFRFTSEKEKLSYLANREELERKYYSFLLKNPGFCSSFSYDLLLSRRSLVLSSLQQMRSAVNKKADTKLGELFREWISTREQLALWLSRPAEEREGRDSILDARSDKLEKELARSVTVQGTGKVNWDLLKNSLKDEEAAVEFLSFPFFKGRYRSDSIYYVAMVTRRNNSNPVLIRLCEERTLKSILAYRGTSAGNQQLRYIYSATKNSARPTNLYELLWKPLENELAGVKTVYFSTDGLLHKLSLAAISYSEKNVLSDKYRLVQLNSTGNLLNEETNLDGISGRVVLMGGIQYEADSVSIRNAVARYGNSGIASRSLPTGLKRDGLPFFNFLQGTAKEVEEIKALGREKNREVELVDGLNANEEFFKSLNGRNSPIVLHIATHGFFFPDPKLAKTKLGSEAAFRFRSSLNPLMRAGLALSAANRAWKGKALEGMEDGILTAYEVSNMDLGNTRLAVLSACETGLGDIQGSEGVFGLQRAFKMAGVQYLVMSLWKVPDAETAEFMRELYKGIFEEKTITEAFYKAQQAMKERYRDDIYKWGAWVLVR